MARTINELIYNIRGLIKDNLSDDIKLTDRQLEFIINYLREKLIVQQLQKGRSISSNITQDLGQIELELVDSGEGSISAGTYILRTVPMIPQPVELDHMDLFTYIGGLDKQSPISYKTKVRATWKKYQRYTSKKPVAYYSNNRIYISGISSLLKYINVEGVFSNPREASRFKLPSGESCYNPDTDNYPISGRMIDMINDLIKRKELDLFFQIPPDTTNNAAADYDKI